MYPEVRQLTLGPFPFLCLSFNSNLIGIFRSSLQEKDLPIDQPWLHFYLALYYLQKIIHDPFALFLSSTCRSLFFSSSSLWCCSFCIMIEFEIIEMRKRISKVHLYSSSPSNFLLFFRQDLVFSWFWTEIWWVLIPCTFKCYKPKFAER